jgi:hypothetical protein
LPGDHVDSYNDLIAVMKENNAIPGMAGYSDANLQGIFGSFNTNDPGLWPRKWDNDDGSMCMFETQPSSVCIAQTGQWPTNWTYTNVGDIFDSLFPKGNKWLKPPAGFTDPKFLNALKCCVGPGQPGSCPPGTQCPGPRSGWPGTVFPTT